MWAFYLPKCRDFDKIEDMVYAPKDLRNQSLIAKRIKNPKSWTWSKLGKHFEIHRSVAKQIFERDVEKYAHETEIARYNKKLKGIKFKTKNLS
jgi:hypothetical protein